MRWSAVTVSLPRPRETECQELHARFSRSPAPIMKPGERIAKIKAVATELATQAWEDIDLTLSQFGFGTSDEWRGDKHSYLIEHLQAGDDQLLTDLDDFLHPAAEPPEPPEPPPSATQFGVSPWETDGYHLFLTHLASEKSNVAGLAAALRLHSIEAFVAHETIDFGAEWIEVIRAALDSCDGLAAWFTPGFRNSDWCDQEIGFAVANRKMIVPIRFGETPYGFIGKIQALTVAAKQPWSEVARSIFDLLVKHPDSRADMAQAIIRRFAQSESFEAVRSNVGYLRMIPPEAWTDQMRDKALSAHEANGQIEQAYVGQEMAPAVVARIVRKSSS
jgi:hypothetical protein